MGRLEPYGPDGIERLNGLEGTNSPEDMNPSSSASQSDRTDEQRGEVSFDDGCRYSEGGFRCFAFRIAVRRYFMRTLELFVLLSPPANERDSCPTAASMWPSVPGLEVLVEM